MQQDTTRPAFVFTEAPGDPSISRSTYENEDSIFFLSVHERPQAGNATQYLVNIFNMGDPMEEEGTVFIMPWAQLLCAFSREWIDADPEVNLDESVGGCRDELARRRGCRVGRDALPRLHRGRPRGRRARLAGRVTRERKPEAGENRKDAKDAEIAKRETKRRDFRFLFPFALFALFASLRFIPGFDLSLIRGSEWSRCGSRWGR